MLFHHIKTTTKRDIKSGLLPVPTFWLTMLEVRCYPVDARSKENLSKKSVREQEERRVWQESGDFIGLNTMAEFGATGWTEEK